jgi:hypothetical protein
LDTRANLGDRLTARFRAPGAGVHCDFVCLFLRDVEPTAHFRPLFAQAQHDGGAEVSST